MIRLLSLVLICIFACNTAGAEPLDDFNAMVEVFAAHGRSVHSYVRLHDATRVATELEAMRQAWSDVASRFGRERPAVYRDNPQLDTLMVDIPLQLVGAGLILSMGRGDRIDATLLGIRRSLSAMRRASTAEVLADCILDADDGFTAITAAHDSAFGFHDAKASSNLVAKIVAYGMVLKRCETMAPDAVRRRPAFRHNIDGALAATVTLQEAIERHDAQAFDSSLAALRQFDDELSWQFG